MRVGGSEGRIFDGLETLSEIYSDVRGEIPTALARIIGVQFAGNLFVVDSAETFEHEPHLTDQTSQQCRLLRDSVERLL